MQSERGETETRRKLLRRVGNWPKVCKFETRGTKIGKEGRGLLSLPKKAVIFISSLCSRLTVDQWHWSYVNHRSVIKDSPRPFFVMSVLRSTNLWEIRDASDNTVWNIIIAMRDDCATVWETFEWHLDILWYCIIFMITIILTWF